MCGQSNPDKFEEKILELQDRYGIDNRTWSIATVRVTKWLYHGQRIKLTIVEGHYVSSEAIDKAIASYGENAEFPNYPKHIEIICRPNEMLELAKILTEFCK
jgi:hypothetical protein